MARDSGLISYRSDLYMAAGFLVAIGGLPGLVAADCGSGFSFYLWPGHCLFVHLVTHYYPEFLEAITNSNYF